MKTILFINLFMLGCAADWRYARTPQRTVVQCQSQWRPCGYYMYNCNDGRVYRCMKEYAR